MLFKEVVNEDEKEDIARHVLTDLPEWFGIPESTEEYIRESRKMTFYACVSEEGEGLGFLSIKITSECTAEVYVLGVKKEYHRHGIGRKLLDKCINWCRDNKYEFLQVKTLSEDNPDKYYKETRKYYRAVGFKPLEVFHTLWDPANPCLILIMKI